MSRIPVTGPQAARYFIGLDAGSSICKAAVFDLAGNVLAAARRETPLIRREAGWVEADPELCWQATCAVLREAVEASGIAPGQIGGLGLSAAMVGLWLVDAEGRALRPGINWEDSRSQPLLEEMLAQDPALLSRIFDRSGSVLQQGCSLPLLMWFDRYAPGLLDRAAHAFSYKDYLRLRLTGHAAADRSEAAVAPGDARSRQRSAEMIALFGLDHRRGLLPPALESETAPHGLTAAAAAATGLPAGLPVAIGAGDVPAMVIGAGGMTTGEITAVLGTTCMLGICLDHPVFAPRDLGLLFSLPGDRWYRSMVNVAGTLNLDWAIAALATELEQDPGRFEAVTRMAHSSPIGAAGAVYLPYLSESGIIAPVVSRGARAQFCGLSPRHGRADLFRAVFEGVAYAMRDLVALLPDGAASLRLTGGGSQSAFWSQMIADVTGLEVRIPAGSEFGARGAALLAATATGHFSDIVTASGAVGRIASGYRPDATRRAAYDAGYRAYGAARDALLGTAAS